jgi:hypothetical protein
MAWVSQKKPIVRVKDKGKKQHLFFVVDSPLVVSTRILAWSRALPLLTGYTPVK